MRVIFYSDKCEYSKKLIIYLDNNNIKSYFKLVNIDIIDPPKEIDIVPTIIDEELNQPLKGKQAFEYILNIKYFNNPTNNIELIKYLPPNPYIKEDNKALVNNNNELELNNKNLASDNIDNIFKTNNNLTLEPISTRKQITDVKPNIPSDKLHTLLKMRSRK